jgi:death-on-curing protein
MSATPANCFHLTVEIVRELHAESIATFGGSDGVRDLPLLESAVGAPRATAGGQSVYADLSEVAGAYLFYLCRNHPFVDGNKRTALGACLLFLRLNGRAPKKDSPDWELLVLDVAASKLDRDATTKRLRRLVQAGSNSPRSSRIRSPGRPSRAS